MKSKALNLKLIPPKTTKVLYRNALKFAKELKFDGSSYFCYLDGSFVFGDFIEAIFEHNQFYTDELIISTLSLSSVNIQSLKNLVNGKYVGKITLILSRYFYNHEKFKLMKLVAEIPKCWIYVAPIHIKQVLFKTEKGNYLSFYGSANLRSSQSIEQIEIKDNKGLYDYSLNFLNFMIKRKKGENENKKENKKKKIIDFKNRLDNIDDYDFKLDDYKF